MNPVWITAFRDRSNPELADYLIFSIFFFALPFFVILSAEDGYVLAKWVYLLVGAIVLSAMQIVRMIQNRALSIPTHPVTGLWVLFFLWQTISMLWAESGPLAFEQFQQSLSILLLLLVFQSLVAEDRRRLLALATLLSLAGGLLSIWVLAVDYLRAFQGYGSNILSRLGDWREVLSTAGFGNTGHIADYLVLCFLVTLAGYFFVQGTKRVVFMGALLVLQSAALVVCWSVHSDLSLIIASIVMALLLVVRWRYEKPWKKRLTRLLPLSACFVAVVLFFTLDQPLNPHHSKFWKASEEEVLMRGGEVSSAPVEVGIFGEAFSSDRWKTGGLTRQAIWLTSISIVSENPMLGVGSGNFTYVYPTINNEKMLADSELQRYAKKWTNAAHNSVLQTWSETGFPGVLLLLGIVGTSAFYYIRRMNDESNSNHLILVTGLAMLIAMSLQAQMNFLLELPVSSLMFVIVTSIPAVLPERTGFANLDMPVSRRYGFIEPGIVMRNMQSVRSLSINFRLHKPHQYIAMIPMIGLALYFSYVAIQPLRASIEYRNVYDSYRMWQSGFPVNMERIIESANRVLKLNPDHREGLSKRIELGLAYSNAQTLEELESLIERLGMQLSDFKIHLYHAQLEELKGNPEIALEHWRTAMEYNSDLRFMYPQRAALLESSG